MNAFSCKSFFEKYLYFLNRFPTRFVLPQYQKLTHSGLLLTGSSGDAVASEKASTDRKLEKKHERLADYYPPDELEFFETRFFTNWQTECQMKLCILEICGDVSTSLMDFFGATWPL